MKTTWVWFKRFFVNYMWLGVVILLVSIIFDLYYPESTRGKPLSIAIKLLDGIGVSVIIASVFTFASGSSEFTDKIKNLLKDIVIKRDFLSNIDPESKKEALKALIQPSFSEKNKYPNIGDYYGFSIEKTLEIKEKSVRSNYSINARAYFCRAKSAIAIEGIYTYRLYPSATGFNDIVLGFEDKQSFCTSVSVCTPKGERKVVENPALSEFSEGGDISYRSTIPVQEFAVGQNHVDVELKLTEYGQDHWKLIQFKALQPTDGFRFYIYCDGNIKIQEHSIFVVGAKYQLDVSENKNSLSFSCNQWVNEGTGLCVLVSISTAAENVTPIRELAAKVEGL
ncbi:hypothetical protein ACVBEG_15910 [Pseudomonas sp. GG8]